MCRINLIAPDTHKVNDDSNQCIDQAIPWPQGRRAVLAVDRLDLQVEEGQVFGFLGPNGAGKTTTVRMLTCLVGPTSGEAWVNNLQVGRQDTDIRRSVGILTETPGLYDRLSAEKNLTIFARLYEVKDVPGQVEKYLRMLDCGIAVMTWPATFPKG